MNHPPRTGLRRFWYVASWRVRHWWFDTRSGMVAQVAACLAFGGHACWSLWQSWTVGVQVGVGEMPVQQAIAQWAVYAIMFVVSTLISMALAPKPEGAKSAKVEVPVVEDGAIIRRIYGPVWIKDPIMLAFKPAGTDAIRKRAGKSLSFKTKWQTIGHHFKHIFQFGLCRGELDSVLAVRAGDKEAWSGELTSNGIVNINKPGLWGGDDSEGGIVGDMEFALGGIDQMPSAYLAANIAPEQSAYRWRPYCTWRGGRWGNSPYPKAPAILVSRILKGWDGGECWYPERARVPVYSFGSTRPTSIYITLDRSGSMIGARLTILKAAMMTVIDRLEVWKADTGQDLDVMIVSFAADAQSILRRNIEGTGFGELKAFVNGMVADGGTSAPAAYEAAPGFFSPSPPRNNVIVAVSDGAMSDVGPARVAVAELFDRDSPPYCVADNNAVAMYGVGITTAGSLDNFSNMGVPPVIDGESADELADLIIGALMQVTAVGGMNIAHALYDSLTAREMDGEPRALVNDASWRAAADRLYNEAFGIGTEFIAGSETIEQFQQRLCDLAGARMSTDPTTGEWHLDLIRGEVPDDILVITDDDVLDFEEQPSLLDEAVNQVTARWTEVLKDEIRATAPLQALGAIQSFGSVNAEVLECPEVLSESLALRLAARNLAARATPLKRQGLKVTRIAYRVRPGQKARLQLPKRGINDMVVVLGDVGRGTLRSGAIALTTVQDVVSMPDTTYVISEPGTAPVPPAAALPAPAQRTFELPYRDLVEIMSAADLAFVGEAAGYVGTAAASPAGAVDFVHATRADAAPFEEVGDGQWCPTALVVEASDPGDPAGGLLRTSFTLAAGSRLEAVAIGTAALWGDEIVRVDALDPVVGAVTLARGCADTVPQSHQVGERIWFYDADAAIDPNEYVQGQIVQARTLTRLPSDVLALEAAPTSAATLGGRAARPYAPARLQINGQDWPEVLDGVLTATWAHRDRIAQGAVLLDQTAPDVGPEEGTTYSIDTYLNGGLVESQQEVSGTIASVAPGGDGLVRVELAAYRDGLSSWQRQVRTFSYGAVPTDRVWVTVPPQPEALNRFPLYVDLSTLPARFWEGVAHADGRDVRAKDQNGTDLPMHLVRFDAAARRGAAFVCVDISQVAATTVVLHYGDPSLARPADSDPIGTFAVWSDYHRVYLFNVLQQDASGSGSSAERTNRVRLLEKTAERAGLTEHQGLCWDGAHYYVTDTNRINKYDSSWNLVLSHPNPCGDVGGGVDHCGDPDVHDGVLYVPVETYTSITNFSNQVIARFRADDLSFLDATPVSAQGDEVSSIVIDAEGGALYTSRYSDSAQFKVNQYSLDTLQFVQSLTGAAGTGAPRIQGLTRFKGWWLVNSDTIDYTCRITNDFASAVRLWTDIPDVASSRSGNYEGLAVKGDVLLVLRDDGPSSVVHYLAPLDVVAGGGVETIGAPEGVARLVSMGATNMAAFTMGVTWAAAGVTAANQAVLSYTANQAPNTNRVTLALRGATGLWGVWDTLNGWLESTSAATVAPTRLHARYDGVASRSLFVDGTPEASTAPIVQAPNGKTSLFIGAEDTSFAEPAYGRFGFVYLRAGVLSDAWIAAECANLRDPGGFYSVA